MRFHWRRPALSFFLSLLFLTGCAGPQTPSGPVPEPSAGSGISPTDLPTPVPVTVTKEIPPTAGFPVVRIRNAATGTYLFAADGVAQLGDPPVTDESSQWVVEEYQGAKRLQNRAAGGYLSIEHLKETVEVIPIFPEWMSPRWTFETDPATGTTVLRNVWHNWQILYAKDGRVGYERVAVTEPTSRWVLETLDGRRLVETPVPTAVVPTASNPADSRGAIVPWIEYEAEAGQTDGEILSPDRTFGTIASESSGRSAVKLDQAGEYVQFISTGAANSVVVRFVIPDSDDGQGLESTISLYIDGVFRRKIRLTSKYAWSYGGEEYTFNTPKAGGAHHFYDEARALVGDIPAGATVRLQKDADDSAEFVVIDLVDLEQVAPPLAMPEGYLPITDCGAVPDSDQDAGDAIQACIDRARAAKTGVWIPAGTFRSEMHGFDVADVTIRGAGMWYSTLRGKYARFNCTGDNCRFADFAILGETVLRDDQSPENGFNGSAGTGSRLENIWVEHTKVGFWVSGGTDGLVITGSRFRDLYADGVNFCNGTSRSVVENSHFRNTGDDALASWSPKGDPVNTGNVFRFNTIQVPWRANCLAIYGGKDNVIENNLCYDVVTYPGILIAQQFNSNPFDGTTTVRHNSLIRAGGPMFHNEHGALKVWADQGEIGGLVVSDLLIDAATFMGIELEGSYPITGASFDHIEIRKPGSYGLLFRSNVEGEATFSFVTVSGPGVDGLLNYAPKLLFQLGLGKGNRGW